VPGEKVIDDLASGRLRRFVGDPVPAHHLVRPERLGGQPVGVQAAGPNAFEPAGFDDVDAGGLLRDLKLY